MGGLLTRGGPRRTLLVLLAAAALGLALGLPAPGAAQDPRGTEGPWDLALRDVPLAEALERLVELTGISLVYSPDVGRDARVFCQATDRSAEALLRCIVESAEVDFYRLSSGTYVVIADPSEAPGYGSLAGQVVDGRTGEPIPEARIELTDGPGIGFTDRGGLFTLTGLLPGLRSLRVSGPGYQPAEARVEIPARRGARLRVVLDRAVVELEPLVVDGLQRRVAERALGSRVRGIDPREDAAPARAPVDRRVAGAPGVVRRPLFADLHLQGSRSGEVQVELDGAPVFEPVSLGRFLSAFSPLAIRRVTVRKAGFGAAHGSYLGGVVDVEHAVATGVGRPGLTARVDPYAVDAELSLPVEVGAASGRVLAAGRRSLWGLRPEPALDDALRHWNGVDPVLLRAFLGDGLHFADALEYRTHGHGSEVDFSDLHLAAELDLGDFRTLDASLYRGVNEISTESFSAGTGPGSAAPDRLLLSRDRYDWTTTAARLGVGWLAGDRGAVRVGARLSHHRQAHVYQWAGGSPEPEPAASDLDALEGALRDELAARPPSDDGNTVEEAALHGAVELALGPGHQVTVGVEGIRASSRFHLDDSVFRPLRSRSTAWRWAGRLEDRRAVGDHLVLEAGLRLTWLPAASATYAEPRLSARWDAFEGPLGPWSVQVAGGLYRQFLNPFTLSVPGPSALVPDLRFWLPSDGTVAPPRSRHLSAELLLEPAPGWQVRAEGHHKWLDRVLAVDYAAVLPHHDGEPEAVDQSGFVGEARGRAWGAGASARYAGPRIRVEGGYDLSVSRRTFPSRFGGRRQPVPWNDPHTARLGVEAELGSGVVGRVEGRSVWGRTWALRQAYYDVLAYHDPGDGPSPGLPEDDRLPALHEVDVGVEWGGEVRGARVLLRAEVRNALDLDNVVDASLRRVVDEGGATRYVRVPRLLPGATPLVTVRISF